MAQTATLIAADPPGWAPVTNHYRTNDSPQKDLAVTVFGGLTPTIETAINQALTGNGAAGLVIGQDEIVPQPTTVIGCNPDGSTDNLTPVATFPPGTSHEDALAEMGYVIA